MDCQNYITEEPERKRGQHLQREDRGAIQHLKHLGIQTEPSPERLAVPRLPLETSCVAAPRPGKATKAELPDILQSVVTRLTVPIGHAATNLTI